MVTTTMIDRLGRKPLHKAILFGAILGFLSLLNGCGGTSSQKETPKSPSNIAVSNTNASTANTSVAANDKDADDLKKRSQTPANSNTANSSQKRTDRDDVRKVSNANSMSSRRDTDDKDDTDSDRDTDDH